MKALVYKDCQMLMKYKTQMLIMPIFFCLLGLLDSLTMFQYYGMMIITQWPLSLMSLDEKCKWNPYALTLPISKTELVGSKYLFSLFGCAGYLLLSVIVNIASGAIRGGMPSASSIAISFLVFCLSLILSFVYIPIIIRFGAEKARYLCTIASIVCFVVLIPLLGIGGVPWLAPGDKGSLPLLLLVLGALLLCVIIFFITYSISKKQMEKLEY